MDTPFRLRPMDLRDILDDTFDLYKENFALFVTISAIVFLPFNLLLIMVMGQTPDLQGASRDQQVAAALGMGLTFMVTMLLGTVATYIGMAALAAAVSERYLGRSITLKESYSAILDRFGAFLLTIFLSLLIPLIGGMALIFLPVFLSVLFWMVHPVLGVLLGLFLVTGGIVASVMLWFAVSFVIPAFVIEGRNGFDAITRSFQLFRFQLLKAFFTIFFITVIVILLQSVISSPLNILLGAFAGGPLRYLILTLQGVLSGIAQAVVQPIQMIVIMLLYYDIRIRREGFDLEVLANELHRTPPYTTDMQEYLSSDPSPEGEPYPRE
jgi:hypothetical protein